jgi:hypothetical protein
MAREQLGAALPPCQLTLRLGPAQADPLLSIEGRVERGGVPLGGATVQAWVNPVLQRDARHGYARAIADDQGHFVLTPLGDVPYVVSALVGGREVAALRDVRGGARGVVLHVAAPGRLRGTVKDPRGAPVPRFSVVLTRADAEASGRRAGIFTRYDARGAFAIDDMPAGDYRLLVVADGWAPTAELPVVVPAQPAGPAEVNVTMQGGAHIRGRVVARGTRQPLAQALVSMEGQAGIAASVPLASQVVTGGDGRFQLVGAPEGRLSLMVTADGYHGRVIGGLQARPATPLDVPDIELGARKEGEQARVELVGIGAALAPKGNVIVLGKLAPSGGASQAGLLPGDAILAIDGEPVGDLGFSNAIQRIRGAENTPVAFKIRRADGREADVTVVRRLISF